MDDDRFETLVVGQKDVDKAFIRRRNGDIEQIDHHLVESFIVTQNQRHASTSVINALFFWLEKSWRWQVSELSRRIETFLYIHEIERDVLHVCLWLEDLNQALDLLLRIEHKLVLLT